MGTDTSIQAVKTKIERIVAEIAALSKADMSSNDFFQKYLERVVAACDAKGGGVWLVNVAEGGKPEFRLTSAVQFDTSGFRSDEQQRAALLKILNDTVRNRQAMVFSPEAAGESAPVNGIRNKTPYPFVHVPICTKDQTVGVLQVWLQPYVQPQNYAEFANFLVQLAGYVENHLQSRRVGGLMLETQRLQHLLRFTTDIAGTLDPKEVARLTANYGRDLAGCERCSVLICEGDRWHVLAISGQETVEKKSSLVKVMTAFVELHIAPTVQIMSKQALLEGTPAPAATPANGSNDDVIEGELLVEEADENYFAMSHVVSAALVPMLDKDGVVIGALLFESGTDGFFDRSPGQTEAPASHRIAEWVGTNASKAIVAAQDYGSLPLLRVSRGLREVRTTLTSNRRRRFLVRGGAITFLILLFALWPAMVKVEGDCTLVAEKRAMVVPEIAARLDRVLVREGDFVKQGQVIAELDTKRLETELASTIQNRRRYLAEADRYRAAPLLDEASAQVAMLHAKSAEEEEKRIRADIASAQLRAPFDGIIVTRDIDLRAGEYLQAGEPLTEIASLENWELQLAIDEYDIATVEDGLRKYGSLDIRYILYAHSGVKLSTKLSSQQQISTAAYPKLKQNLFVVTSRGLDVPADIKAALRPGLTGRGSVELHRRPQAWNMARRIVRWFRLKFFT